MALLFKLMILYSVFSNTDSLRVLVYSPAYAASHTNFMARLADTLTEAGHNVTFFTPIIDESRKDQFGVKLTKDVLILEQDEQVKRNPVTIDNDMKYFWTTDVTSANGHKVMGTLHKQAIFTCENVFKHQELIDELRSRNYDIGLAEPLMTCGLALFRHIGIEKVMLTTSCTNYDILLPATGEPEDTSYNPSMNSQVTDVMSFWQRLENYDLYHVMIPTFETIFDDEANVYRKYLGESFPDWRDLIPDASLHFTNSIPFLDFPRPSIQKTIEIGGIAVDIESIPPVNEEFSNILDKRPMNMLISFGSLARSTEMPIIFKENLLRVFQSEPNCTFIWKYESDDVAFANDVENVIFVKWMPQTAILKDNRLTAFLTHGGLGSTNEAAFLGKPSVMFPIFADQSRNSNMLGRQEMSIVLHKSDLGNFQKIRDAFHEILHNEKYHLNARKVADMVRNQPAKPRDIFVKHVEFVGRFGPLHHMTPYSLKMPFYQRYHYDIFIFKFLTNYFIPVVFLLCVTKLIFSKFQLKKIK
ncbi:glucuronosyltransferase [Caenorhabditis elegans]|uniref:glucuronosyltransferase n=1 Tax=Caenorhabditis elegans TaxID=6239 RepID=O01558_CAEEL|nr:glucuronosyltransferase [Caenorhabditis elegans]CCD64887.1 glucuronosyltransferase [Caenorhabditis elegans]|eukprot:NP_504060.2 UDP-GlucuronosylTransferase [Caenorhabditis elegans]